MYSVARQTNTVKIVFQRFLVRPAPDRFGWAFIRKKPLTGCYLTGDEELVPAKKAFQLIVVRLGTDEGGVVVAAKRSPRRALTISGSAVAVVTGQITFSPRRPKWDTAASRRWFLE